MSTPLLHMASAPGVGAVGVLMLIGPGSQPVLERALGAKLHAGGIRHGQFRDARGPIEDVLCCWHSADRDGAGVEWAEVDTHGSLLSLTRAAAALTAAGAAGVTEATGENIAACFLPGADGIARVALAALPQARTPRAVGVLIDQACGALSNEVRRLLSLATPGEAVKPMRALLARAATGRACLSPPHVALVGPTNAGKSTLFNCLVGRDRALVHETPGTTRDRVEEEVAIAGVPLRLSDTAGLRDTATHPAEQLGMSESLHAAQTADLVLLVVDPTEPDSWSAARGVLAQVRPNAPIRLVWSKSDRLEAAQRTAECPEFAAGLQPVPCSAHTGAGLPALDRAILEALGVAIDPWPPGTPVPFLPAHTARLTEALRLAERGAPECRVTLRAMLE